MDETWHWGRWGLVPADRDVRPFSRIAAVRGDAKRNNKRHHFISVTYMNGFVGGNGRVWAYRSEQPRTPLFVPPPSIGFENFYYSQKLPDGSQENHRFEDLWNAVETVWPETIRAISDRRISHATSFNVLGMATIMRTRVPAARERNEVLLAAKLRAEARALEAIGRLPAELQRYAGELETVPVGINPHETLLAMRQEIKEFGDLCFRIGFEVLHNTTALPFITSDNPVCIYDPGRIAHFWRPYEFGDEVELLFPLDAWTLLRGSHRLSPVNRIVRHRRMSNKVAVRRVNRTIAKFAYRLVVASNRSSDELVVRYADVTPTVEVEIRGELPELQIVWRHVFGPLPKLFSYVDTPEKAMRLEAQMSAARGKSIYQSS